MNRLNLVKNHLSQYDPKASLEYYRSKGTSDAGELQQLFFGGHSEYRKRIFQIFQSDPIFKPYTSTESDRKESRYIAFKQIKKLVETLKFSYETLDNSNLITFTQACAALDYSLSTKFNVHFFLYCKSIMLLGTSKHTRYLQNAFKFEDIGCFGLTELEHGSNTRGIRTTAEYSHATKEFIITTPENTDMKVWIGAAAHLANMSVVWAQLIVNGKNHGIHPFIVPIRNKSDHTLYPGVIIGDMGSKVGLNGIDNGFMIFKGVRIPYDNLLDRFSSINEEGEYKSPITPEKRFGYSLGALTGGRIQITDMANHLLLNAVTIATRFTSTRRQFGQPGKPETVLIEYPLTQYRLIPLVSHMFAISFANQPIVSYWSANQDKLFEENNYNLAEIHALSSALKPYSSWKAQAGIQECRELCGGLGYSAYNRLGALREENDINATWEGDNNVLLQQTGRFLLEALRSLAKGKTLPFKSLQFLKLKFSHQDYHSKEEESLFAKDKHEALKALEIRANFWIHALAAQLEKEIKAGNDAFDAWNTVQVPYVRMAAFSYGELYIAHQFQIGLKRCRNSATKEVLKKLYSLFVSIIVEGDSSLYEIGYLNQNDSKYLREEIKKLCADLKSEVNSLIDAIAPPDEVLNSPIGAYDGDIYNRFISTVFTAPGCFEKPDYWREIVSKK